MTKQQKDVIRLLRHDLAVGIAAAKKGDAVKQAAAGIYIQGNLSALRKLSQHDLPKNNKTRA
mgnify:CR=1 FL=1